MKKITFLATLLFALPLHADLRQQIESKAGWVGYSVPIAGQHTICSWDDGSESVSDGPHLQPSTELYVLYHVEGGRIDGIRLSSPQCGALNRAVQWLDGVDARESAVLLRKLIDSDDRAVAKKAVTHWRCIGERPTSSSMWHGTIRRRKSGGWRCSGSPRPPAPGQHRS